MTIALIVQNNKKIVIAADRLASNGFYGQPYSSKIKQIGPSTYVALAGGDGIVHVENILTLKNKLTTDLKTTTDVCVYINKLTEDIKEREAYFEPNRRNGNDLLTPSGERTEIIQLQLLVISPYGVWEVQQDLSILEIQHHIGAVGAGATFAMGALHVLCNEFGDTTNCVYDYLTDIEQIARKAVQAAIAYSPSCGGSIDTIVVQKKKLGENHKKKVKGK